MSYAGWWQQWWQNVSPRRSLHEEGEYNDEGPTLSECNKTAIVIAYIIALIAWTALIVYFRIGFDNGVSIVVVLIPYIIFITAIIFVPTDTVFCDLRENTFFAIGLVAILPIITWFAQHYHGDKQRFITIAVTAVFVSMIALFEFCLPRSYICLLEHTRSILQTVGISLLIYVIAELLSSLASGEVTAVPGMVTPSKATSANNGTATGVATGTNATNVAAASFINTAELEHRLDSW